MMKEKKTFQPLTSSEVFQIYESLLDHNYVSFPLTIDARKKVESLVATVSNKYFGEEIYITTEEKVVAYLYMLIKNHPFTDGNKRTASIAFKMVSKKNNLRLYPDELIDNLVIFIEKIQEIDHHNVIKQIARIVFT